MFAITPILKALGIKVEDEDIRKLEVLIPQIPGKISEVLIFINNTAIQFHERLAVLEKQNEELKAMLTEVLNGRRTASIGDGGSDSAEQHRN